jgi:hypothetical protein
VEGMLLLLYLYACIFGSKAYLIEANITCPCLVMLPSADHSFRFYEYA